MAIVVECSCGKQLRVKDAFAGKTVKCSQCRQAVLVMGVRTDSRTPGKKRGAIEIRYVDLDDIPLTCPHCRKSYRINSSLSGMKYRHAIEGCGGEFVVPIATKLYDFDLRVTPGELFGVRPAYVAFDFVDRDKELNMLGLFASIDSNLKGMGQGGVLNTDEDIGKVLSASERMAKKTVHWPPFCVACGKADPQKTFSDDKADGIPICIDCGEDCGRASISIQYRSIIFANGKYATAFAAANGTSAEELPLYEFDVKTQAPLLGPLFAFLTLLIVWVLSRSLLFGCLAAILGGLAGAFLGGRIKDRPPLAEPVHGAD